MLIEHIQQRYEMKKKISVNESKMCNYVENVQHEENDLNPFS